MATKRFSGNSNYELEVTASRSGNTITVTAKVNKLAGSGFAGYDNDYLYRTVIDGNTQNDTWGPYNFASYSTLSLGSKSRSGLTPGVKSWSVTVTGASSLGTATISGTITIPPNAPAAPTINTPTRTSDTSHTVRWTRNATPAAPYESQQVQRQTFNGSWGSWVTIATLGTDYVGSAAMSQVDSGTVANRAYKYRVRAINSGGSSLSGETSAFRTTPGRPSSVVATKLPSGSIAIEIAQTVTHASYRVTIEYSTNAGSSWTLLTNNAGGDSYTHISPPAGSSIVYRARVYNYTPGDVGDGLMSDWRTSNTVPLLSPPNAPSSLSPNGVAFDADTTAQLFQWRHNPADTSGQTAYELRYRIGSGSWTTTGKVTGGPQARTFAAGTFANGNTYEWQVRTWGAHADPSVYSASATFNTSGAPSVTITSPSPGTLAASRVVMTWEYFDPEGTTQAGYQVEIYRGSDRIGVNSRDGSATSYTFATVLEDDTTYTVRVRVRDGALLWSEWDEVTFTTDFPVPLAASLVLSWDPEQGAVVADITNPPGGPVAPVVNELYHSVDGETWTLAVAGAEINTAVADGTVPVGVPVLFRVITYSALPSAVESPVVSFTTPDAVGYWSAGEGFGQIVAMEYGNGGPPRIDFTHGLHEKTLHYFAGRTLPVEAVGIARDRVGAVAFMVTSEEQLRTVRELAYLPAPHLVRVPDGTVLYCSISEVRSARVALTYSDVSFTVTEVTR